MLNLKDGRVRESLLLMLGFVACGIQLSVVGPILPDLSFRTGNTLTEYGVVFVARSLGNVGGAALSMLVVDRIEYMALMCVIFAANAIIIFMLVFSHTLWQVAGVLAFDGVSMGILDAIGNVAIMRIWKRDEEESIKTTFLHLLHAAFALGGLMEGFAFWLLIYKKYYFENTRLRIQQNSAPVVARPFISTFTHNETVNNDAGCHLNDQLIHETDGNLDELFFVLTLVLVVVATLAGLEWLLSVRRIFFTAETVKEDNQEKHVLEKSFEKELAALLFCFFCFYVGCEMVFTNFIFTFGVCQLNFSRDDATALISIFWVTFTVFRALSAIQARYQSPKMMLWLALTGSFLSSLSFMFIQRKLFAFIASGFFGASMSNCFATGFLYAEGFTQVTGRLASTFILGGALGWAVVPSFAGWVLESDPQMLPLVVAATVTLNGIIMYIIDLRGKRFQEALRKAKLMQLSDENKPLTSS